MTQGFVVCFSGQIGSGKSSVTSNLANALEWTRTGFSDHLRRLFKERGVETPSRKELQDLGQSLVEQDPDGFISSVLRAGAFESGGNLLLDGLRHTDILCRVIRLVAPSTVRLIHISAADEEIRERVKLRRDGLSDLERALAHVVESEVQTALPQVADCVVNGSASLDAVVADCFQAFEGFGIDAQLIGSARSRCSASECYTPDPDRP